jgi:DNA-binding transcriptional regulator YhcF (GntR family)
VDYIFDNKTPIYMQLVDKIRLNIVSGKLKRGERLLSVRELALEFKVNPNTMQKALVELEQEGLIYTQRTSGKFVTENEDVIRDAKCTLAMNKAKTFMQDMESIGINKSEVLLYLQEVEENFYGTFKN